jgi:myo-inositol-1(or 4)-monophosphatase
MTPNLNTLITLAKGAGEILRAGYGQAKEIRHKGTVDLVTQFDHQSEDYLVGEIHRQFPQDTIVTEESGLLSGSGGGERWYLDPLDGTVNFAHGVPMFAVSIAYEETGQMKYGVVYEPLRDECFCAEAGKGATLNGEPIQVSTAPDLIHSLMVTGFPYDLLDTPKNNLDNFVRFSRLCQGVRRLGSAALDLCYVACGRLDGYWEIRLSAWDIAAGSLIVREAGGVMTDLAGDPQVMKAPFSVLAANPVIHPLMLGLLQDKV